MNIQGHEQQIIRLQEMLNRCSPASADAIGFAIRDQQRAIRRIKERTEWV